MGHGALWRLGQVLAICVLLVFVANHIRLLGHVRDKERREEVNTSEATSEKASAGKREVFQQDVSQDKHATTAKGANTIDIKPRATPQPFQNGVDVALLRSEQFVNRGFKHWLNVVNNVDEKALLSLGRQCAGKPESARCRVTCCTALYLEEPYLEEWLRYHLLMGIDHFYLMLLTTKSHETGAVTNRTREVLKPYIERGQVTTMDFAGIYPVPSLLEQVGAISKCFKVYRKRTQWMTTFDVDEFYFSRQYPTVKHLVEGAEKNHTDAIKVPWYMFGASGHMRRPSGLTISAYTQRAKDLVWDGDTSDYYGRRNGKMWFRGECFEGFPNTHKVDLARNCVSTNFTVNGTDYHLKHFQTKSYEDWVWKRKGNGFTGFRGKMASMPDREWWNLLVRNWSDEWLKADKLFNDTQDYDLRDSYARAMGKLMTGVKKTADYAVLDKDAAELAADISKMSQGGKGGATAGGHER